MQTLILTLVCLLSSFFVLQNVRCYEEPELFEEIRIELIKILRQIDVFLKREENNELRKIRLLHRWRLFHKHKDLVNASIVNHDYLEYNKFLGIVCPKNLNMLRRNMLRYKVESLSNINFEVILNTLQKLQAFVNLTAKSTTPSGRWKPPPWKHPVFDDPQFKKDIVEHKKFDLLKYLDGKVPHKKPPTTVAYRRVKQDPAVNLNSQRNVQINGNKTLPRPRFSRNGTTLRIPR
ncbi:hypothetical protein M8J76_017253 [Diaphorina citri]|nr:hypothetical protein M8J76_017253 [Diaphorina citri]